jgi:hypothetical protein
MPPIVMTRELTARRFAIATCKGRGNERPPTRATSMKIEGANHTSYEIYHTESADRGTSRSGKNRLTAWNGRSLQQRRSLNTLQGRFNSNDLRASD